MEKPEYVVCKVDELGDRESKTFLMISDYDEYVKRQKEMGGGRAYCNYMLIMPDEPPLLTGSAEGLGELLARKIKKSAGSTIELSPRNKFVTAVREGRLVIHCLTPLKQDEKTIFLSTLVEKLKNSQS